MGLALALLASVPAAPIAAIPVRATVDPLAFFMGTSSGEGVLRIGSRRTRAVVVESHGTIGPDGALEVTQQVREQGKPARTRTWRMRATGGNRYEGTLSDAAGPVRGVLTDNRLRIDFATSGGLAVTQRIIFAPDGASARNRLAIRKWGVVVARLDESITRTGR